MQKVQKSAEFDALVAFFSGNRVRMQQNKRICCILAIIKEKTATTANIALPANLEYN